MNNKKEVTLATKSVSYFCTLKPKYYSYDCTMIACVSHSVLEYTHKKEIQFTIVNVGELSIGTQSYFYFLFLYILEAFAANKMLP